MEQEITLEQQQAIALANARLRLAKQQSAAVEPSFTGFLSDILQGKGGAREDIARNVVEELPTIGSVVGGIVGAPAGFLGSAAGTAIGTSIGTSGKQLIQNLLDEKRLSPTQTLKEQGTNVVTQTALDLAGSAAASGISKAFSALSPHVRQGAEAAQQAMTAKGGTLSGAQSVESTPVEIAEAYARSGAGGRHIFSQLDKRNATALENIANDIVAATSQTAATDYRAGKVFQSAIGKGSDAHQYAATQLYANLDNALRGTNVSVDAAPLKQFADDVLQRFQLIANVGKTEAGGTLLQRISALPDQLSFSSAHELRSELLQFIRDAKSANAEGSAIRNATIGVKKLEALMEDSAKTAPPDLYQQYRNASAFYKHGMEAFNNELIVKLLKTQPERVGEELFRSGNVSEIIQSKASLRAASRYDDTVNAADAYSKLQSGYLRGMFGAKGATNPQGETLGLNILKDLATSKTDRTFAAMFTGEQRKAIREFAETANLAIRNKPAGFGTLAPIVQATAALDLVSGAAGGPSSNEPLADIGILVSPYILARMLTNPRTVNLLTRGLQLPPGSHALASVAAKLSADVQNIEKELSGTNKE